MGLRHLGPLIKMPVQEVGLHLVVALLDMRQMHAGMQAMLADHPLHFPEQDALQPAAVDGILRPVVARFQSARLPPDELAELVVVRKILRADGRPVQLILQTEIPQDAHRVGEQVDAHAQFLQRFDRFIDLDFDSGAMQEQRRRQSADPRTDNNRFSVPCHACTPLESSTILESKRLDFIIYYSLSIAPYRDSRRSLRSVGTCRKPGVMPGFVAPCRTGQHFR